MTLLLELSGSIALLLWGLRMVRTGVLRAYGTELKRYAMQTEGRIIPAFSAGLLVAALLQSSTATALIASSFSGQGILSISAAFMIILGADVGTAIAAIIASQKITVLSPLLLTIGVFGYRSSSKSKRKNLFRAFTGLGLILLALSIISKTATHLATYETFIGIVRLIESAPFILLLFSLLFTYLAHSSLAIILLTTGFVVSGLLNIESGLVMVLGANLGSGLLPVLASRNDNLNARVPVVINLLVRLISVAITYYLLIWLIGNSTEPFTFDFIINNLAQNYHISTEFLPLAFHLALNIFVALFGLLLSKPLTAFVIRILPPSQKEHIEIKPLYLDEKTISSPATALACAKREILVQADIVQNMLRQSLKVFNDNDDDLRKEIVAMDDSVDTLYSAIKLYVAKTLQGKLTEQESQQALDLLSFTTNMEHIGDIVDGSLMELAGRKIQQQSHFSKEGLTEISAIHEAVSANFETAVNTFISGDCDLAKLLYESKAEVQKIESDSVSMHLQRIGVGLPDSLGTSSLHLDVLRDFKRINSHLTATAYPVLIAFGEVPNRKLK
ncbi:MAG: Na/Pi cotransporter family protein [Cocleimonas sp.]